MAEAAGVSITTVSHALSGKGRLQEDTRRRVREVAEELGYRPNALARSLAGGRTGLIGLAVSQTADGHFAVSDFAYFMQVMTAAAAAALQRGYALVLASGPPAGAWLEVRMDGVIVVDPVRGDPICESFRSRGVPVVTTGRDPAADESEHWVDNDHRDGTRSILDHLADSGARRVGLVASPPVTSYATDARAAYEDWCAERGQEPLVAIAAAALTEDAGFCAAEELLQAPQPPDAIYATLDRLALGSLLAAQASGLDVPEQLMIAGCTDSDVGRWARPSLTALELNPERIGAAAVAMLADLIEGREPPSPRVLVPSRILSRASTQRVSGGP